MIQVSKLVTTQPTNFSHWYVKIKKTNTGTPKQNDPADLGRYLGEKEKRGEIFYSRVRTRFFFVYLGKVAHAITAPHSREIRLYGLRHITIIPLPRVHPGTRRNIHTLGKVGTSVLAYLLRYLPLYLGYVPTYLHENRGTEVILFPIPSTASVFHPSIMHQFVEIHGLFVSHPIPS